MTSGEEDYTKRSKAFVDVKFVDGVPIATPSVAACLPISIEHIVDINHKQILGTALKSPTFAQCVPTSIENDAIAYDAVNDRFKVDIEAMTVGTINTNVSDRWARQLGQVDLARVLGAALAHSNPVIARLTDGSAFIDPRDMSDRAARLVGVVYGSQAQQILQRATTYDLIVQLRHNGVEIDPRNIRALTSSDIITAYGSLDALQQRATTKELIVQIQHQGVEKDPTQIRALTNADVVSAEQSDETKLKATVTQAAKDRTISDVDKVATEKQLNLTFTGAENQIAWDPAAGKKVRVKLFSFELSASVDLGYRWGATGTIYYFNTTSGRYVANLIGANVEGAADDILYFYASGACTVKGFILGEEL